MIDQFLVGAKTVVDSKGDGPAVDVSSAQSRVFLLSLEITNMIEQESLDVGIAGSGDGSTWMAKPIVSFPQKFYRGEQPLLLDLRAPARKRRSPERAAQRAALGLIDPAKSFAALVRAPPFVADLTGFARDRALGVDRVPDREDALRRVAGDLAEDRARLEREDDEMAQRFGVDQAVLDRR